MKMAPRKSAGRPRGSDHGLSKQAILSTSLKLVQRHGVEAISFRKLAIALDVSPMGVKHHVGAQHDLLADLVEIAFKGTLDGIECDEPEGRLKHILEAYCTRAITNSNLISLVLADTSLIGNEIRAITRQIRENTQLLHAGDPDDVLLGLLVDYTHGFVFSYVAAGPEHGPTMDDFRRSVDWVLNASKHRLPGTQPKK